MTADPHVERGHATVVDFVRRSIWPGLDGDVRCTPITGGVSSSLLQVESARGAVCVKQALAELAVAATWKAPLSRNATEWRWLVHTHALRPDAVPEPLAHDPAVGMFAMSYLAPAEHPTWKSELFAGRVREDIAASVGTLIGQLHAASAGDPDVAHSFATDDDFDALRIDPYFRATAGKRPEVAESIELVARATADRHSVLVHGDVSPKNILCGPGGPILLDAECAWYGDPAFDVAFCLNHLALKALAGIDPRQLRSAADQLVTAYLAEVDWEQPDVVETRVARLLPVLLLARVDGKSPVEYLDERGRETARTVSLELIRSQPSSLGSVLDLWFDRVHARP